MFASGTALNLYFVITSSVVVYAAMVGVVTLIGTACIVDSVRPAVGRVARVIIVPLHLLWIGQAAALVIMLGWSVPTWLYGVIVALALVAVADAFRSGDRLRVPIALPLGVATAVLLAGWSREDGLVRCDDYLRVQASPVRIVVPSTPALTGCTAGRVLGVGRYPRRLWEPPIGNHLLVTTQGGRNSDATPLPSGWFTGAFCDVDVGTDAAPVCFGEGKGQGIAESRLRNRLYVVGFGFHEGWVYQLPIDGPLRPTLEARVPATTATLYVDDEHDVIGLFTDHGDQVYRLRASDLAPLDPVEGPFAADQVHYDPQRHEGILCFGAGPARTIDGEGFSAVAFRGAPFTYRPLAPSSRYPSSWMAATWGCDWDPETRRAYVAVATLGLLEEIDYDSGRIIRRVFTGFGIRSVAFDRVRRRIYAARFLSGDVIAIDADSGAVVDRWFVGRFVRYVTLARDKRAVLVTSILGVLRIPLPEPATVTGTTPARSEGPADTKGSSPCGSSNSNRCTP